MTSHEAGETTIDDLEDFFTWWEFYGRDLYGIIGTPDVAIPED